MNRVEYQKWLDQFPEDTEIECLMTEEQCGWYDSVDVTPTPFEGTVESDHRDTFGSMTGKMFEYYDWSKNSLIKPDQPYYNKKILQIGKEE